MRGPAVAWHCILTSTLKVEKHTPKDKKVNRRILISTLKLENHTPKNTRFKEASFDFSAEVRVLRGPAASRPREFRVHGPRDRVQMYFF